MQLGGALLDQQGRRNSSSIDYLSFNTGFPELPYDRRPGDAPALTDAEIDDVVGFLRTLTDGFACGNSC